MIGFLRMPLAILLGLTSVQVCNHSSQSGAPTPPKPNAVQSEMRLLHEALRDSVTALANGTVESMPERLEAVNVARRSTERAVASGEYRLPKNSGSLATFEQLDDRFHAELESLAAKARAKDAVATGTQVGVVLSQCSGCHTQFRP